MNGYDGDRLVVRILGATAVSTVSGRVEEMAPVLGVKPRQILGMLAVRPGVPVSKEQLAERLWDGQPPRSYLATLESYVCVLRRQLGVGSGRRTAIATASRGYVLDPQLVEVDAVRFQGLAKQAESAAPAQAVGLMQQALSLVEGPLLSSEPYAAWAEEERSRFDQLLVRGCLVAARAAHDIGDHEAAVEFAGRALEVDPLTEAAWLVRMRSLAQTSQPLEALRCYSQMRRVLAEELGVEPGPEAQALYMSLLRPVPAQRGEVIDTGGEVKALLALLRQALEAVPGIVVPVEDDGLSAVAARLVNAA
jgi:DNA-binding SARP family transcriptional activator